MSDAQDWERFIGAAATARTQLRCAKNATWYRGIGDNNYRLYPSLLRPRAEVRKEHEADVFREFMNLRSSQSLPGPWDALVEMQHTGTPTPLMDWTETFFVAFYFAVKSWEPKKKRQPAIYVLNPKLLAQKARRSNSLMQVMSDEEDTLPDYETCFVRKAERWPFAAPLPFWAQRRSARIRAQRGAFTIHGRDQRPLDAIAKSAIRQIRVPLSIIRLGREYLEYSGIDENSLFPDEAGFAEYVRKKYGR